MRAAPARRNNYADATCPTCHGEGLRYVHLDGEPHQDVCDCTHQNYALHQVHALFGQIEFHPPEESNERSRGRCRWITGLTTDHVSREIAGPLYKLFRMTRARRLPLTVRVVTDLQIREAYFMPSRAKGEAETRTELDKLVPASPGLVILLLGHAHKHAANGTALAEYLSKLRGHKVQWKTAVWICDSLWRPYDPKHPAYTEDVAQLLSTTFGRIELCDSADIPDLASVAAL